MATTPAYPPEMDESDLRDRLLADEAPADLGALGARAWAAVEQDRGPLASARRLGTPVRTVLVLLVAVGVAGASAALLPRPDLFTYPLMRLIGQGAAMLAGGLAGVWLAMRPTWRPEAPPWAAATALGLALGFPLVGALLTPPPTEHAGPELGAAFAPITLLCFVFGAGCALVVVVAWRLIEQRRLVGPMRWATAAAAGAAIGNLALHLHCPVTEATHLLLGHAAVGFVGAAVGALGARLVER